MSSGELRRHLQKQWPLSSIDRFRWTLGPIESTLPGFGVYRVNPRSDAEPWIYVSDGASRVETFDGGRFEFFLLSPKEDPQHVETLAMIANFHADSLYRVHLGKVIDIGQPWIENSNMRHLLVSLPFPYGPKVEYLETKQLGCVRVLWLLPISPLEAEFVKSHGLEALESRFDDVQIDCLDRYRASVV